MLTNHLTHLRQSQLPRFKARLEKKRKNFEMSQEQPGSAGSHYCLDSFEPDDSDKDKYMTREEQRDVELLVNAYRESYEEMPYSVEDLGEQDESAAAAAAGNRMGFLDFSTSSNDSTSSQSSSRSNCRIISMFSTIVKRMFIYARKLPGFSEIPVADQGLLLRGGILEMCLLRGAMVFDSRSGRWPNTNLTMYRNCPTLKVEHMKPLVSPKLFELHMDFIRGVQELKPDESTVMLLSAIVLICPDRRGLTSPEKVSFSKRNFQFVFIAQNISSAHGRFQDRKRGTFEGSCIF